MTTSILSNTTEGLSLFDAIERLLADPEDIRTEAEQTIRKFRAKHGRSKSEWEIRDLAAKKIISAYSNYAACIGAATALTGIFPGIGTALALVGGSTADMVLVMKIQVEMTMALAVIHGHDITNEERKRLCFLIAALGAVHHGSKEWGTKIGSQAFIRMVEEYLEGTGLQALRIALQRVGIVLTRNILRKVIPFGVGAVISSSTNKALTCFVGRRACDYFRC